MEDKNKIEEILFLDKKGEYPSKIREEKDESKIKMEIEKENEGNVNHLEVEKEKHEIKDKNNYEIMEEKEKKEETKKLLGKKRELKEEKEKTEEDKKSTQKDTGDKSELELNNSNSDLNTKKEKEKEKEKPKKTRAKKKSEMNRDDIIMKMIKKIRDIKKKDLQKTLEEYIKNGFENFIKKKEYDYLFEYDFFLYVLIRHISILLEDFKDFKEDYTYYIYNNLRVLTLSKELNEALKKVAYNKENESFYQQFLKFTKNRWDLFISSLEKYKCKLLDDYKKSIDPEEKKKKQNNSRNNNINANAQNNNSTNNNNTNTPSENKEPEQFDMNKAIEIYKDFPEDNQLEIMVAGVVFNSLLKIEKDYPKKEPKLNEKDKNSITPTIPVKVEIQNFNLSEMAMVSVISGIKFYTNITEINISGNPLSLKSCFWLGSAFKTNPNILILDISRCNIDNERLYLFIEGTKFTDEKLNKEQFNLERLNLKDNNQISSKSVEGFEYPLALILEKFKLKWINLTNAKISGEGALKFVNKMESLLNDNKLYLENLVLICNEFKNEECLSKLGDVLIKENCPIKNIILSKNLISTKSSLDSNINHFEKFMECLGKSKLKELFLISCDIGTNENDIDILCKMLEQNKSLISLRLFGNKLNRMDWFTKILSLFSDFQGPLINNTLKSLDLSKNACNIKVNEDDSKFMKLVEHLKLEYLDVNQNMMEASDKETFKKKTNDLTNIKIIY